MAKLKPNQFWCTKCKKVKTVNSSSIKKTYIKVRGKKRPMVKAKCPTCDGKLRKFVAKDYEI